MGNILKKAVKLIVGDTSTLSFMSVPKNHPLKKLTERELIQLESEIGAQLFGEIPAGHRREFFCLDPTTWIWHEEWKDPKTHKLSHTTTRYEIHEKGILKVQDGPRYDFIEGAELSNLLLAIDMYYEQVTRKIYKRDPVTGQKIA